MRGGGGAVDVLEVIRTRRMHRAFAPDPVEDEALARLVWAAGKAPMGGAELVRRLVVVTDPRLRLERLVVDHALGRLERLLADGL